MKYIVIGLVALLFFSSVSGYTMDTIKFDNGWILVSQVRQDVYRIEEYYANCYLVIGKTEAVLIDTGYGASDLQRICSEFTKLPITVINTHGHFDHIGGDQYFSSVMIHKDDAPELARVASDDARNLMKIMSLNPSFPKHCLIGKWYITPTKPMRLLSGGELLGFGDIHLEVISTPGHTPGSICLLDRERRLLFTGDSFNLGKLWISNSGDDLKEWLNRTGLRTQVELVLPGHAAPLRVADDI